MSLRARATALIAMALFGSACGRVADDEPTHADGAVDRGVIPPITEDQMPSRLAHAICDELDRCCRLGGHSGRADSCVDTQVKRMQDGAAVARAAGGTFNPDAASNVSGRSRRACINALRTRSP